MNININRTYKRVWLEERKAIATAKVAHFKAIRKAQAKAGTLTLDTVQMLKQYQSELCAIAELEEKYPELIVG